MDTKCICAIRQIYKAIAAFETELQANLGLNINEAVLLCMLSEEPGMSAGEIADAMNLTRSNASKVISAMELAGYVKRRVCKEDSRSMRFHLTKKGIELLNQVHCDRLQVPKDLQKIIKE